ncbi:hypothetical protein AB3S75_024653 [Citrus x aurantiifolia]
MLGRVRAASSTPYDLELERMPSKLIKDDSLSIYEATLMKLKLGARRDLGPPPEVSIKIETECDSAIGANSCSDTLSARLAESGCNSHSVFKGLQRVTSHEDVMMTDSEFSSELRTSHKLISRRGNNDRQLWVICKQFTSF